MKLEEVQINAALPLVVAFDHEAGSGDTSINQSFIVVKKTIKLTPRPRMALNGATLQQQLTVHNTGAGYIDFRMR